MLYKSVFGENTYVCGMFGNNGQYVSRREERERE